MLKPNQQAPDRQALFARMARQVGACSGAEVAESAAERGVSAGAEGLDAALRGGFRAGCFYEFAEPNERPAGASLVLEAALQAAQKQRQYLALVDACDGFCPETADPALLEHLFWVRCRDHHEALKAADYLVRDANFSWVCLDFRGESCAALQRIESAYWFRLQRAAKASGQVLLALVPVACAASASQRLRLEPVFSATAFDAPRRDLAGRLHCLPGGRGSLPVTRFKPPSPRSRYASLA